MKLSRKQQKFNRASAILEQFAVYQGYQLTSGDAYRDPRCRYGHDQSTHRFRLAKDYNLFLDKGNQYLTGKAAGIGFNQLHDFWDMLGGAPRIADDLNHFSFEHNGIR